MINKIFQLWEETQSNKKILVITGSDIFSNNNYDKENNKEYNNELLTINNNLNNEFYHLLNLVNLMESPDKIWNWISNNRPIIEKYKPTTSHMALAKLELFFKDNFSLITENIDGMHNKAGSYRVIEMNGNLFRNKILNKNDYTDENLNKIKWDNIPQNKYFQPLRPDIVLQGENPERKKILQTHILAQQSDIILIIGNKMRKNPFNEICSISQKSNQAKIIEINNEKYCDMSDIYIKMDSDEILPLLVNLIIDLEKGIRKNTNNI